MASTIPLPTLSAVIDGTGIWAPPYADILASLVAQFRAIYGSDAYLEPDGQDGQWLAILAQAIDDANQAMVATYNAFSPATAAAAGLSSVVKINGLRRQVPSNSSVDVELGGQAGIVISNGVVGDDAGNRWDLPASVTIPLSATIVVTAICETAGAVYAEIGEVNTILTPQPGWHSVYNHVTAAPGQPVETDYQLRRRQSVSTALPAQAILEAILANVEAVTGVSRALIYENDGDAADADGLPPHSIAVVAEGGDAGEIATAIANTKPPGSYTHGSVTATTTDPKGVEKVVRFFPLRLVTITIEIWLTPLDGWLAVYGNRIVRQVSFFVSTLPIGYDSYLSKLFSAAELAEPEGLSYDVTKILQRREYPWFTFDDAERGFDVGYWFVETAAVDIPIAFNEAALSLATDVLLHFNA